MKKQIKVLMVPSDLQGVGHFRNIWAAQSIQKHFAEEIKVDINYQVNTDNIDYLSQYDIIHFHRQLGPFEKFGELSKKLKEKNVTVIMDIDDFWEPPVSHPLYEIVKNENLTEKIKNNIKLSEYITTTTETFKTHIQKLNPNVFVIPNALDMSNKMWKDDETVPKTDKCRIAWIGGSSHLYDLELLKNSINKLNSDISLKDKYQIVLCGFDTRGTITQIMSNGQQVPRKIRPEETIWLKFEQIFTSNYELLKDNADYVKWLKKAKKKGYEEDYNKNYLRRWTLPLTQYGKHYNYCDVCLAPLQEKEVYKEVVDPKDKNKRYKTLIENPVKGTVKTVQHYFNEVKSELKIIETGMKKKVLIAQNFGIYKELLKDGVTGLLVSDNKKDWYKAIKKVILNKDLREELANNLHNFVKNKYDINNVTKQRVELYKELSKKKVKH